MPDDIDIRQVDFGPPWRLRFRPPPVTPMEETGERVEATRVAIGECAKQHFQSGKGPYVNDNPPGRFTWRIRLGDGRKLERTGDFDFHVFRVDAELFSQPGELVNRLWQEIQTYLGLAEGRFFSDCDLAFVDEIQRAMDNTEWLLILNDEDVRITYPQPDQPDWPSINLRFFAERIPKDSEFLTTESGRLLP